MIVYIVSTFFRVLSDCFYTHICLHSNYPIKYFFLSGIRQQQQKRHPDEDGKDAAGHHAIGGGGDTVRVNK